MEALNRLLKSIRGVGKNNPVTQIQLSEIIRGLWRDPKSIDQSVLIAQDLHAFVVGTPIRFDPVSNAWVKSQADTAAHAGTVGIVSEVIDESTFRYIEGGLLPGDYTNGADYYLSEAAAGTLKICDESTVWENGMIKEFIGYGTPEGLQVNIDRFIEISEQVQSDWLQNDPTKPDYIKNKPAISGDNNTDGGFANSTYLPSQLINGGNANG